MHISITAYGLLVLAVLFETVGSSVLEKSDGMTHVFPIVLSLALYGASFVLGAYLLKVMPVGIMYALWSGIGVVLIAILGYSINKQPLDAAALLGMGLIAAGVVIIYLYSKSVA